MLVQCPHCGGTVVVNVLGRKRLNIPLKNISECLQAHRNVVTAADKLGCSPAYIFGVLKANGLKLKDVMSGKGLATKDTTLLNFEGLDNGR